MPPWPAGVGGRGQRTAGPASLSSLAPVFSRGTPGGGGEHLRQVLLPEACSLVPSSRADTWPHRVAVFDQQVHSPHRNQVSSSASVYPVSQLWTGLSPWNCQHSPLGPDAFLPLGACESPAAALSLVTYL